MLGLSAAKLRPNQNSQAIASVPAPAGGLNTFDTLSNMDSTDAYDLQNWIPSSGGGIAIRKGYGAWADSINGGASVKSVMAYFPSTATVSTTSTFLTNPTTFPGKIFCATDANIYEITSPVSNPAAAQALSGTAEAGRISHVNFSNSAGDWLIVCSEADGYFTYSGAAWTKVTMGAGANQVSGVDPVGFVQVAIWKNRLWFVQKGSSSVWYLDVNSLYGAAHELDLGPLLRKGGGIAWIANWTIDAGEGIDDMIVFASENGEILVYKGTDPSSATTFSLVGRWSVGAIPKGRRAFVQYGGDLLVLSAQGISPLSYVTRGGGDILQASKNEYTKKITAEFNDVMSTSFNQYGWGMELHPKEGLLIVTVPDSSTAIYTQYAMNVSTGAWTKFQNMNMLCTTVVAGWMLFGTASGTVNLAFYGYTDNGNPIQGIIQPAFNNFGQGAQMKHFLMARLSFLSAATFAVRVAMNTDFETTYPISVPPLAGISASGLWDTAIWDTSKWGGLPFPYSSWFAVTGVGYYGSLTVMTSSSDQLILTNIDYVFEKGGAIG